MQNQIARRLAVSVGTKRAARLLAQSNSYTLSEAKSLPKLLMSWQMATLERQSKQVCRREAGGGIHSVGITDYFMTVSSFS